VKRLHPSDDWPKTWKESYSYDLQEVYGEIGNRGYAYAYDNRRRRTLELISEVLEPGARILDMAAAQGNFSLALAEMGYAVTWNDLRHELADYVQQKHERGVLSFAPGNAFELEFPFLFDAVLITEIIEHVAHPDDFLLKAAKLVRPGGYIILTTPNGAYFRNHLPRFSECADPRIYEAVQFKPNSDGHIFLLHPGEIRQITNPLTNGHIKLEPLLRVLPRWLVDGLETFTQRLPKPIGRRLLTQTAVRLRRSETELTPDRTRQ
jgi:2-polyprenyl-3-methyl-5-hydroxy-6-metoxy-1,4-benzoquinol methylase